MITEELEAVESAIDQQKLELVKEQEAAHYNWAIFFGVLVGSVSLLFTQFNGGIALLVLANMTLSYLKQSTLAELFSKVLLISASTLFGAFLADQFLGLGVGLVFALVMDYILFPSH